MIVEQAQHSIERRHAVGAEFGGVSVEMNSVNRCRACFRDLLLQRGSSLVMPMQLNFSISGLSGDEIDRHCAFVVARSGCRSDNKPGGQSAQLALTSCICRS